MSDKPETAPGGSGEGAAVFGFEDLQALREEYDERIRLMKEEHEAQLKSENASRQELIADLSFELAASREEGELRARTAEAKANTLESELRMALAAIDRIEAEVQRVKLALADALSPTGVTRLPEPDAPVPHSTLAPVTAPPAPSLAAAYPAPAAPASAPPDAVLVQASDVVATAAATADVPPPDAPAPDAPGPLEPAPAPPVPPPVPRDATPATTAVTARRKKIRLR